MGWNNLRLITVNFNPDDALLAAGDTVFDATEIPFALRDKNQCGILRSLMLIDPADQGAALDLYFFDSLVAFGTPNAAPGLSDADALKFLGKISIATGDYADVGGVRVAHKTGLDFLLKGASDSASIWMAATCVATPTYGTELLTGKFGVEY